MSFLRRKALISTHGNQETSIQESMPSAVRQYTHHMTDRHTQQACTEDQKDTPRMKAERMMQYIR